MASLETIHGKDGWESCILNRDQVVQTVSTGSARSRLGHLQRLVQFKQVASHEDHLRDFWDMTNAVKFGFKSTLYPDYISIDELIKCSLFVRSIEYSS